MIGMAVSKILRSGRIDTIIRIMNEDAVESVTLDPLRFAQTFPAGLIAFYSIAMKRSASPRARRQVRQWGISFLLALIATACALLNRAIPPVSSAMSVTNETFYDIDYRLRPFEDRTRCPVVIVAADQGSLDVVKQSPGYGWPWPRELWGAVAAYAANAGAKAVVFDLIFSEPSIYNNQSGDDDAFAAAIKSLRAPVVFGSYANADGSFQSFAPPVPSPLLAATNINTERICRTYSPMVNSKPSLAVATVKVVNPGSHVPDQPFLLHYYGPNVTAAGNNTFLYISAAKLMDAQVHGKEAEKRLGLSPDLFKDKIVLLGAVTQGTYDLKATPLGEQYPGVEVQATAIQNMLQQQRVIPLPTLLMIVIAFACGLIASVGVIVPRKAVLKLLGPAIALIALLGVGILLFRSPNIHWLPPAESLLVLAITTPTAFAYTFFAEDRQRKFMLKALSKVVSPAIAEQLAEDPQRLALGTVRTEMTVLFTDLANFTTLSESMGDQQVGELLNRYLGAMSDQVLRHNGTLDKYIGDAVMCFWNAPLPQENHAALACRAALAMIQRELEIRRELGAVGEKLYTRIGINTTSAAVGFVGSSHLFNYTAIGDGVNLASRLEGANKLYGTRILISDRTAQQVKDSFVLRKIDKLKVKGKTEGICVHEVIAERGQAAASMLERVELYESALSAYQDQNWDAAERILLELCNRFGEDSPSRILLDRIAILRVSPPSSDWDGTFEAKEK